ncbi:hypothetical protein K503DRAFT_785892 [Rhizopogon vinicolor AM-OR11-026]|uniref:Uncharacterized protein n=1 Tax=Rhizopogon vinicolor AM-OR11-026 TaxID=1314800 RepID=A0A1B7MNV5_9AGAM|nr:hypothetical protein K503DRAFT_785892 [Rhizopogon vinicolor AM-OR11-026]
MRAAGDNCSDGTASTSTSKLVAADESLVSTLVQCGVDPDPISETSSTVVNESQAKADRKGLGKFVEDYKRRYGALLADTASAGRGLYRATEEVEAKGSVILTAFNRIHFIEFIQEKLMVFQAYCILCDDGAIHAPTVLYRNESRLRFSFVTELLETVLFANMRFHEYGIVWAISEPIRRRLRRTVTIHVLIVDGRLEQSMVVLGRVKEYSSGPGWMKLSDSVHCMREGTYEIYDLVEENFQTALVQVKVPYGVMDEL